MRRPGEVRDAIIEVLSESRRPLHLRDIHAGVEEKLGGAVAPSSVRSYMQLGTEGSANLFERVGRGTYKLRRRQA